MGMLEGKKAIIIGDRDGIPGPAIAECVKTAGAQLHRVLCVNQRWCNGSGEPEAGQGLCRGIRP